MLGCALAADHLSDLVCRRRPFFQQRDDELGHARASQPGMTIFGLADEPAVAVV
jgi:hypothetical protein